MNLVFEAPLADKAKLIALLEADPYGEKSFSRNGYKVKEGSHIGQDREKIYVFMKATDEFAAFAKEKLKDCAKLCSAEVAEAIAKKIEEEETNAEKGFGFIFSEDS